MTLLETIRWLFGTEPQRAGNDSQNASNDSQPRGRNVPRGGRNRRPRNESAGRNNRPKDDKGETVAPFNTLADKS